MAIVHFGTGQAYTDLQAAINAAGAGGTVICHAGTYHQEANVINAGVTIQANGSDTVILDGWVDTGRPNTGGERPSNVLPSGQWMSYSSTGGTLPPESYKDTAASLIRARGANFTIDGIDFTNSAGRMLNLEGNVARVRNCNFSNCRGSAIHAYKISDVEYENLTANNCVNFYLGGDRAHHTNHPGVFPFTGCTDITLTNVRTWNNGGETFLFDTWRFGSTTARIYNSYFSDSKEMIIYIHGAADVEFHECVFFGTQDNESWGGKGFRGVDLIALEHHSNTVSVAATPCGTTDVTIHNSLFVNTRSYLLAFNGDRVPSAEEGRKCPTTFLSNVEIRGCTFVQNGPWGIFRQHAVPQMSNITLEGNVFYLAPGANAGSTGQGWNGITFNKNIWNRNPGHAKLSAGAIIADPMLENPSGLLSRNVIDPENYKLKAGSPAIGAWANQDLTTDFYGNARAGTTGDLGFVDYDSSGPPDPDNPNPPTASFDQKSGGLDVTEVEPGDLVELFDTSTPGSGETLNGWTWEVAIIGSAIEFPGSTQNHSFTPTVEGTYSIALAVSQTDGQESATTRTLVVSEIVEPPPPPPPPPSGDCDLTAWSSAIRAGNPTFNSVGTSKEVICQPGDQGLWRSSWAGQVSAGSEFYFTGTFDVSYDSGYGTIVALYYDSAGTPVGEGIAIPETNGPEVLSIGPFTQDADIVTLKIDVRLWNGTGSILFDAACVAGAETETPPVAIATMEVATVPVTEPILSGTQVDFDASQSTGTAIATYAWEIWIQNGFSWDPFETFTGVSFSKTFTTLGAFSIVLIVYDAAGQNDTTSLGLQVEEIPTIDVSFLKFRTGDYRHSDFISGEAPLKVTYEAQVSSSNTPISYKWELLDQYLDVLGTYQAGHLISLILPLPTTTAVSLYGMRLTIGFASGLFGYYEEHGTVEVFPTGLDTGIGPPTPASLSPYTENRIDSEYRHTHDIPSSNIGAEGSFVPVSQGSLLTPYATVGSPNWHDLRLGSLGVEGAIIFKDAGVLRGSEIIALTSRFIIDNAPTFDPVIRGCLWNDNGVAKFSEGLVVDPAEPDPGLKANSAITAGVDDAGELSNGVVATDATLIRLNSSNVVIGFMFDNITIPPGSTISSSFMTAYVGSQGIVVQADIALELSATPAAFVASSQNLSNRTLTTAVHQDRRGTFGSEGFKNFTLPTAGIQEVIDLPGWISGNSMVIIFNWVSGANLAIIPYDVDPVYAATLEISYT